MVLIHAYIHILSKNACFQHHHMPLHTISPLPVLRAPLPHLHTGILSAAGGRSAVVNSPHGSASVRSSLTLTASHAAAAAKASPRDRENGSSSTGWVAVHEKSSQHFSDQEFVTSYEHCLITLQASHIQELDMYVLHVQRTYTCLCSVRKSNQMIQCK